MVKNPNGPSLILAPASFRMDVYSARDGEAVWWVRGLPSEMKSVPVVVGDRVFVSGFNTPENDPGKQVSLPTWTELLARADPCAFAVTRIAVDFRSAARIDEALEVHTWFEAINGPRLMIRQEITRDGALIASAEVEAACIRPGGGARRPPPEMREKLTSYLAPAPT